MTRFFIISLLLLLQKFVLAQPLLVLNDTFQQTDLAPWCRVLTLTDGKIQPKDIAALDVEKDFIPAPSIGLNFGYEATGFWATFLVENQSGSQGTWVLNLPNPYLYTLNLYQKVADSLQLLAMGGLYMKASPTEMLQFYHFPLRLQPGEKVRYYLLSDAGKSANNPAIHARLFKEDLFFHYASEQSARRYFFAAIFLVFILITLILHLSIQSWQTFWLLMFIIFGVLFLLSMTGVLLELSWPIFRHASQFLVSGASGFALISFVLLFIEFYNLDSLLPKMARGMRYLTAFFAIYKIIQPLRFRHEIAYVTEIVSLVSWLNMLPALYIFGISIWLFFKKRKHRFLLFAELYLLSIINIILLTYQDRGILPLHLDIMFLAQIGFSIEFALLLTFIGYQIFSLRRNYAKQQLDLLEARVEAAENLLRGQQEERRRLRLRLHDGLGVLLASTRMRLSRFTALDDRIHSIERDIATAATEVRNLSHDLDPEALRMGHLFDALHDMVARAQTISSADVSFSLNNAIDENQLPQRLKIALYYIAQELLHNSVKHSEATQIKLSISFSDGGSVLMKLEDDGKGLMEGESQGNGIGIENIRARVATIDGKFSMVHHPEGGLTTIIEVRF